MSYNNMSGTVFMPTEFLTRPDAIAPTVLSGNLSTSDAADVINVPRVSNATNNAILTNVGGDANALVCESNLTFDGDALNIIGNLTASTGASLQGPLHISASTGMQITGSVYFSASISASSFYGDGSNLTGVGGNHIAAEGPSRSIQFHDPIDGGITGSASLLFSGGDLILTGALVVSGNVSASGHMVPVTGNTFDLGSADNPWRNLYVSSSTIYFGEDALSVQENNLKFGSGSTVKGFDVGFMNFKNNGIFMEQGRLFKLGAYQIQMFGGIGYVRKVVASNYSINERDYLVGIQSDSLSNSITLTLPSADNLLNGQTFVIKDEGGAINTHPVTVSCAGSDTIDGQNQVVLMSPYASIQLYCNGSNKFFIC